MNAVHTADHSYGHIYSRTYGHIYSHTYGRTRDYTQVSSHIRDRQSSIGIDCPV
ncbi:hypothetical protein AB0O01_06675 [Streptomyces sp. NPDC093252]|uniref:hypothetical protein n=1 Tax=Streptomyces sp. NPDC093252 TaxID=3154980 RepID=UPI00341AAEC2